jgi:hypothetical protein
MIPAYLSLKEKIVFSSDFVHFSLFEEEMTPTSISFIVFRLISIDIQLCSDYLRAGESSSTD